MQVPVQEQFAFGDGGWVRYLNRDLPCTVFARFVEDGDRLVMADLFVTGHCASVKKVPLGRIEALANAEPVLRKKIHSRGPDLRALFAGQLDETLAEITLVLPDASVAIPQKRPYPLAFYEGVARVYTALVGRVRNPVGVIADANHVPLTTAKKWVRVARSLGLLSPAVHGRAG